MGTRNGSTTPPTQYFRPVIAMTATESPCNPVLSLDQGVSISTAEVDGITSTDPQSNDDGDGLNDSYEALILLTDPYLC